MLRSLRRMSSEVVLRRRSFHGGGGHWDGGCVVVNRAQCLAWPAHREHASFLRHIGRVYRVASERISVCRRDRARRDCPMVSYVVVWSFGMSKRAMCRIMNPPLQSASKRESKQSQRPREIAPLQWRNGSRVGRTYASVGEPATPKADSTLHLTWPARYATTHHDLRPRSRHYH
jgi:hypothetical protein